VYPALASVPSDPFGLAVAGTTGRVFAAVDASHRFALMSASEPFVTAESRGGSMNRSVLVFVAILSAAAAACAGGADGEGGDAGALEGVTWVLQRGPIDELTTNAPEDARVDLLFEDGSIAGQFACNRYGGPYETEGSSITFGELFSTEMACEQPLMDVEAAYLSELGEVREFQVSAEGLVLTGAGVRLAFDAEASPEPRALVGTVWTLETVGTGGDGVASPVAGSEVTLELAEDGTATGSGGCNSFRTSYRTEGTSITFEPVAATEMACEPEVADQEASVFQALESASSLDIAGDLLTLNDADGGFLLAFRGV
jgi:heat shock protein HslJ